MKIEKIIESFDSIIKNEEKRAELYKILFDSFTAFSRIQILNFQNSWDGNKPYVKFRKELDERVFRLLKIEASKFGTDARAALGLEPLIKIEWEG